MSSTKSVYNYSGYKRRARHNTILLQKLTVSHSIEKIPGLYKTQNNITIYTKCRQCQSVQLIHYKTTNWRSILYLLLHLGLRLPSDLFTSGLHNNYCTVLPSPISSTRPAHHIPLVLISRIQFHVQHITNLTIMQTHQSHVVP